MAAFVDTLTSYVPALIVRRLIANPAPISERFPAAVLFADISGFTPLTEQLAQQGPLGSEILTRELNAYFGQLINLITVYGGDVVKFAGDALTALWKDDKDSSFILHLFAFQAAACAPAVQAALKDYQTIGGPKLALRIGLGAGEVAAVHIGGVYGRWEFVITGSPLKQVSQAESLAQPGEVIVSPEA